MQFNTLAIEATKQAEIPKGLIPFRWHVHHVKEIFMAFLPKVQINNSAKIEVVFGPRKDEDIFDGMLGATNFFIEDFDFSKFYSLDQNEQDLMVLNEFKSALISICNRKENNKNTIVEIENAASKTIQSNFFLEIPISKLGKKSPNKKHEVNVKRVLSAEVGESWCCIIYNKDNNSTTTIWMTKKPDYLDRTDFFKKAKIGVEDYTVFNSFGKSVFHTVL